LKRKREENTGSSQPPNKKLQEFLEVMRPGAKSNTWSNEDHTEVAAPVQVPVAMETIEPDDRDDGFSDLPLSKMALLSQTSLVSNSHTADASGTTGEVDVEMTPPGDEAMCPVSDADWLRSKTSRVLDLTDDVDSLLATPTVISGQDVMPACAKEKETSPFSDTNMVPQHSLEQDEHTKALETISQSGRLFVRNLPYSATEQDLQEHFSICGPLQEVGRALRLFPFASCYVALG
jgi:multiple RNA-binding domain-containing protein 1